MTDDTKPEGVSPGMLEFFNGLTPEQREGLTLAYPVITHTHYM